MVQTTFTLSANTLHYALELSKNSWLLAIQCPDREQPSLHSIEGGNTEKLMANLIAARDCWAKTSSALPVITLCYEVGHDAFWLAWFLKARGAPMARASFRGGRLFLRVPGKTNIEVQTRTSWPWKNRQESSRCPIKTGICAIRILAPGQQMTGEELRRLQSVDPYLSDARPPLVQSSRDRER
jgi:hypothetical protein